MINNLINKINNLIEKYNLNNIIKIIIILIILFIIYRLCTYQYTSNTNTNKNKIIESFTSIPYNSYGYGNTLILKNASNQPTYSANQAIFILDNTYRIDSLIFKFNASQDLSDKTPSFKNDTTNPMNIFIQYTDGNGKLRYLTTSSITISPPNLQTLITGSGLDDNLYTLNLTNIIDENGLTIYTSQIILTVGPDTNLIGSYQDTNKYGYIKEFGIFGGLRSLLTQNQYNDISQNFSYTNFTSTAGIPGASLQDVSNNMKTYAFNNPNNIKIYSLKLTISQTPDLSNASNAPSLSNVSDIVGTLDSTNSPLDNMQSLLNSMSSALNNGMYGNSSGNASALSDMQEYLKSMSSDKANSNTANSNTANSNTANSNTANFNTNNSNTNNSNTANSNTGNSNTNNSNTGNSNTNNSNTGNSNTGNSNTANSNTANSTISTRPATTKPATTKPATTKPATTKPATTKPATTNPQTTISNSNSFKNIEKFSVNVPPMTIEPPIETSSVFPETPFIITIKYNNLIYPSNDFTVNKRYNIRADINKLSTLSEFIILDEPIIANQLIFEVQMPPSYSLNITSVAVNGTVPTTNEISDFQKNVNMSLNKSKDDSSSNICPNIDVILDKQTKTQQICDNLEYQDKVKSEKIRLERNKQYLLKLKNQQTQVDELNSIIQELENKRLARDTTSDQARVLQYQQQKENASAIRDLANQRLQSQDNNKLFMDVNFNYTPPTE
jgi:hypothetical protein